MAGRHWREPEKKPHRFWWVWLIAALAVVALLGGALWMWREKPIKPVGAPAVPTTSTVVTTTTTDTTAGTTTTTVPPVTVPPEVTPPVREFARPEEMRGVWLTEGVDYAKDGTDEATVQAEIDKALAALKIIIE